MAEPRPFSHRDRGTDEPTWLLDANWDTVPRLDLAAITQHCPRVVLIAPHPDDESLALGATLADLARAGVEVTVVVATHGGAGPGATVRRAEGDRALAALDPRINALWWDFPDGGLSTVATEMHWQLAELVDQETLLLAPADGDGHADHEAVARVAKTVALECSAILLGYPIWLWHWARPADLDWARLRILSPSLAGLQAKAAALDCYTSQVTSDDGYPIVGPSVLARARRVMETVLVPASAALADRVEGEITGTRPRHEIAQPFDAMLDTGGDDPWGLDTSAYEIRRLAIILACLGRQRYGRVMEIGCATGQLSEQLKDRADDVIGLDASARALDIARTRTDAVRWVLGAAPADLPDEQVDLVVLSEVGYFLDGPDLLATLRAVRRRLRTGGEIVIANWRGRTRDIPLDGPTVQAQAASVLDLPLRARYEDADLTIEVWGEPVSVHDDGGAER